MPGAPDRRRSRLYRTLAWHPRSDVHVWLFAAGWGTAVFLIGWLAIGTRWVASLAGGVLLTLWLALSGRSRLRRQRQVP
jgi:hypothetical protein